MITRMRNLAGEIAPTQELSPNRHDARQSIRLPMHGDGVRD
jgi:hypothetical protein